LNELTGFTVVVLRVVGREVVVVILRVVVFVTGRDVVVVASSHLGLSAPFVQQYFPANITWISFQITYNDQKLCGERLHLQITQ